MLYLAEVQKPKSGFNISGRSKPELKLLACQRTEQNWSAIPGEELVVAPDEANNFNPGVLVMVEMNANRQIQSQLRDAGKHLVGILQNLSRQIEKYKKEADEIESWRQSLSLQSQQLQLRQEEIYGREEDLEQTRAELDRLSQEAQALEATVEQHERSRKELSERWEQLQAKERLLEQQQQSGGMALSEQQVAQIRTAIHQLSDHSRALDSQQLETTISGTIEVQQQLLDDHWQQLRQQQQLVIDTQAEIARQQQEIDRGKQQRQELETALEETQTAWEVQQHTLSMQQEFVQRLTVRIGLERENYQKIYSISKGLSTEVGDAQIDLDRLEAMPIEELQTIVKTLQAEVERSIEFVHLEEEELQEKQATIDELHQAIATANEFDKLKLEAELADEQDGYDMLDHTMEGQRQTMRERQTFLQIHTRVLHQRQGIATIDTSEVEWDTVLDLLEKQLQHQQAELTQLETEIHNLRETIEQAKSKIEQQVEAYLQASNRVESLEKQLQATQQTEIESLAKIELYQATLQPLQDRLDRFKEQVNTLANTSEDRSDNQEAMQHIESLLNHLVHGTPIDN